MRLDDLRKRVEGLCEMADELLASRIPVRGAPDVVDTELMSTFRSASLSFLSKTFGKDHPFFVEFDSRVDGTWLHKAQQGRGIIRAARLEIENGWLQSARGLASAEIFSDFMEMAKHLLDESYKDAAAVMIGSVLEEHLRQLCARFDVATVDASARPRKASALNADLGRTSAYSKFDEKSVTALLDLRNQAAHGRSSEYAIEQVRLMHQTVTDFIARNPC